MTHRPAEPVQDPQPCPTPVEAITRFFEALAPADLDRLGEIYAADARFIDPFSDVTGLTGIRGVYAHMFRALEAPRFVVLDALVDGPRAFLRWDFHFSLKGRALVIHGGSWLELDDAGRIRLHRDYWDAAGELYAKLPVLGALMRWLRRRAAGP